MLERVKKALRISHNLLDDEVSDLIDAARHDLRLSGVSSSKSSSDTDPLIRRAIVVYSKANFGLNNTDSEKYQKSYDMLKRHLTMSGDYNDV